VPPMYSKDLQECIKELVYDAIKNGEKLLFTKTITDLILQNIEKLKKISSTFDAPDGQYCFLSTSNQIIFLTVCDGMGVTVHTAENYVISFNDGIIHDAAIYMLMFYLHAEVETVILDKIKGRTKFIGTKYINESNCKVKIIDSKWFRNLIQTEGFNVRGHFAFRRCGQNYMEKRLVWINEYQKKGIKRQAGILKNNT